MEQKQEVAANYINDIRECIINLVAINESNTAALIELSALSRQLLALHKFMQDTFKSSREEEKDICEYYPRPKEETAICACGSDIAGTFVCTKEYSRNCQWANKRREQERKEANKILDD